MGSSIQKNGLTLFLLSDQAILTFNKDNVPKFFRNDEQGNCHEVDAQGKPINSTRAIFPSLTYLNRLSHVYFKRSFTGKKKVLLATLKETIDTLYTKTLKKKTLKKKTLEKKISFDFSLFLMTFLGDIPPIAALKEEIEVSRYTLQTIFFDIDLKFFRNEDQEKTNYFFSHLELQYILEEVYPNEDLNKILEMRSQVIDSLKILGFAVTKRQRRVSPLELPEKFYTKLISSGQYTPQNNTLFSYGILGIRLSNRQT